MQNCFQKIITDLANLDARSSLFNDKNWPRRSIGMICEALRIPSPAMPDSIGDSNGTYEVCERLTARRHYRSGLVDVSADLDSALLEVRKRLPSDSIHYLNLVERFKSASSAVLRELEENSIQKSIGQLVKQGEFAGVQTLIASRATSMQPKLQEHAAEAIAKSAYCGQLTLPKLLEAAAGAGLSIANPELAKEIRNQLRNFSIPAQFTIQDLRTIRSAVIELKVISDDRIETHFNVVVDRFAEQELKKIGDPITLPGIALAQTGVNEALSLWFGSRGTLKYSNYAMRQSIDRIAAEVDRLPILEAATLLSTSRDLANMLGVPVLSREQTSLENLVGRKVDGNLGSLNLASLKKSFGLDALSLAVSNKIFSLYDEGRGKEAHELFSLSQTYEALTVEACNKCSHRFESS